MYSMNTCFFLPSILVGEGVGEERFTGWQPISAISLQQSPKLWQSLSQKHPLIEQGGDKDHSQHPE